MGLFKRSKRTDVAEAKILAMAPTARSARQEGRRNLEFEFRLATPGGEVPLTCRVPHQKLPAIGQVVPILINPEDPSDVEIDFERVPDAAEAFLASARASEAGDPAAAARALGFTLREK